MEHLSSAQIEYYRRRKISHAELLGIDDHLAECAECRHIIEPALNNDAIGLYAALAAEADIGPHLTFDQTAAYVDGLSSGGERRMIEDHLASCALCAPLTDDLRAFRNGIAPDLGREYRPREMEQAAESAPQAGRRDGVVAAPLAFFPKIPFWIYTAPALMLLVAVVVVVWVVTLRHAPPHVAPTSQSKLAANNFGSPSPEIANVIVRLNDGGVSLALDDQGRLTGAGQWPSEYRRMAAEALSNQSAPKSPLLAGLNRPGILSMRGNDEGQKFAVIEPAGKVVLTDHPRFKWTRLEGANGYVVEIYDAQFNPIASSPTITDDGWTAPQLARGRVYSWQVKASSGGQEFIAPGLTAAQAKFRILDQSAADEIAHARRDYPSSHLLLGLLYARAGLLAEAEQEFRALQKANPDSSLARKLAASVNGR
ncbi:MAG: zf-HC2 domain-containing protein [Chloracidobacterium sp.]|nr:zf-HC2 domain-containing protein [Chloracidobacterium sp.]